MGKLRPFVQKESYMPNKKWIPFVIGNGYTTVDGASGSAPEWDTAIGNPVSFNAIAPFPLRQLKVAFSPVQSGSGDPSPDNVRPISGWSSLTVEQRGKNLLKLSSDNAVRYNGDYWFTPTYGENSFTFKDVARVAALYVVWELMPIVTGKMVGMKLTMSATTTGGNLRTVYSNIGTDWSSGITDVPNASTVTIPASAVGHALGVRFYNDTGADQTISNLQVEIGETASTFVPYNPSSRSISISLGQTVYSGTLDVLTGVVTVDMAEVDMASLSWTATTLNRWKTTSIGNAAKYPASTSVATGAISSSLKSVSMTTLNSNDTDTGIAFYNALDGVFARNGSTTQPPTGQIVYELATPIPIQLTPQEVESLAGDNNLWSDANQPITVTYRSN